jgi:predicted RNA-binding Zn-ribbon protein involved in translation (DUF1610 family)
MIGHVLSSAGSSRTGADISDSRIKSLRNQINTGELGMETVCQACGYQRKPTDQAPDWECPSCGKAYVKTSHPSPSPLVIYADNPPSAEAGSPPYRGSSYRREPKETTSGKYGILIGAFFFVLFLVFGIPVLANPSSASDIIFHSNAGFTALLLAALVAAAVAIKRMRARGYFNNRKSTFVLYAAFPGFIFAVLFLGLTVLTHNEVQTDTGIQRNGLRTMADIVRIYNGGCGRRSCSINVEYAFRPSTETNAASESIHGYADLGDRPDDPRVIYARTNKQVPIAYEVDHPDVSALNFDDDVFRLDPNERYRGSLALLGKIFLGCWALMVAIVGIALWLSQSKQPNAD